ncbi:MAG: class I SAM-dependent methyltransferase [Proteobacteria bacterium]|nr:class I SAM-dependent methyltransferase [Pseudomonadota bacterium]
MTTSKSITKKDCTDQYSAIHSSETYGNSSERFKDFVSLLTSDIEVKTILDYGCGQSKLSDILAKELNIKNYKYDPSIKGLSKIPTKNVDLVTNTDVLEHIPEDILDNVLETMASLSDKVYFNIHNGVVAAFNPNEESPHCTVHPAKWWQNKLQKHFKTVTELGSPNYKSSTFITWNPTKETIEKYDSLLKERKQGLSYKIKYHISVTLWRKAPALYFMLKKTYRKFK